MFQMADRFLRKLILCAFIFLLCPISDRAQSEKAGFPLELDHILVWVSKGAPEAAIFEKLGLHTERRVANHTGQGTASIAFYFENAYFELIWIEDEDVAAKKDEGFHWLDRARWKQTGASPFGIGLHRHTGVSDAIPFPTRKHRAEYMKPDTFIEFATSTSNAREPMCFVVPDENAFSPKEWRSLLKSKPELQKHFVHPLGVKKLTGVKVTVNGVRELSTTASLLSKNGIVTIEKSKVATLELTFDGGERGKTLDARPVLPILLKY